MKIFLKILAGLVIFFVILVIGLNLYFTDERLKNMILPEVREATGSEIQVDNMSITFFRTFPRFGLEMDGIQMPDPSGNPVATIEEVLLSVELYPLFRDEIAVSRLNITRPVIFYTVFEDSTSNIDFLTELAEDDELEEGDGYTISVPGFMLRDASVYYSDHTSNSSITLEDFDADISLQFAELIESTVDARLGSISAIIDGENYINNLSLSLNQTSTLDLENEILTLTEGTLSIRGLALNLTGSVTSWSEEAPDLDLQFTSTSENFGELLRLAPPQYDEMLAGLETRGSLVFEGSIQGRFTEEAMPQFDVVIEVTEGYLRNPDLPEAIEDIHFSMVFNNELATISDFRARAGVNSITASGSVERPLDDDGVFSLDLDGDVNLATVSSFYPIDEFGIEEMAGLLKAVATATGRMDQPENATFAGNFNLSDGMLKYAEVPRAIEQINARIDANQNRIQIAESGFTAATNRFSLSGNINNPLDEDQRTVDISSNINFDLATVKDFYPIDEDTLTMRGQLVAEIVLRGRPDPDQIETLLQQSTFQLTDGYLSHEILSRPLEDITFRAEASGRRLSISNSQFKSGENELAVNGTVVNYLSDNPEVDLNFDGRGVLSTIANYYSLEPWIQELTGDAVMNLNVRGPANDIQQITLNGALEVNNVTASGDSLFLPVTDLSGKMNITPTTMNLEQFSMNYGGSDISLQGSLQNYMGFLEEHESVSTMPSVSGSYSSRFLNMDEMIDWDEEADGEPVPIELPNLTASVNANIERLVIFGLSITEIEGNGRITPDQILIDQANAKMFDGNLSGKMDWSVPDPLRSNILFEGKLEGLKAETFFRDTGFLGENRRFHNHVTGEFSSDIRYYTELDETLAPDITTADASGTFGMNRARMQGHPIQVQIARFLNASELESLALDEWTASYTIEDAVLTFRNLRLTSGNLGIELQGTQHLVTNQIDYKATLLLPERFKRGIASVISNRAADALQLEDGRMAVPVRLTGTSSSPQVRPDTDVIEGIIRDYIRDGAGNVLRRLFGGE